MKDYYKVLGVDKNATEDQIKKAFRKLAHEHHPDKSNGNDAKFKEINEAYQVLGDKEKRKRYDQFGNADFNAGSGFGGGQGFNGNWQDFSQGFGGFGNSQNVNFDFGDLGDVFGDLFGMNQGRSRKKSNKGRDIEVAMEISFEDAVFGAEKVLKLRKDVKCDKCSGMGGIGSQTCPKCHGTGQVRIQQNTFFGAFQSVSTCPDCDGSGNITKETCSKCHGAGVVNEVEEIKVKIPAGIDNGQSLRLTEKGESGKKGGVAGDLYIRVKVNPSQKFKRDGYDIKSETKVKYSQLILGDNVLIDTVDGAVKLKIPPHTSSGKVFILKDRGVFKLNSRGRGNHIVTINLDMPDSLSRDQKKLIEELQKKGL